MEPRDVTALLQRMAGGDERAAQELLPLVYEELHGIARRAMRDERGSHTLQPTALVHEAWLRLAEGGGVDFDGRGHFLGLAATAMRRVLVDHARSKKAQKRGGGAERLALEDAVELWERETLDLEALDLALTRLAEHDPELERIVELRFFGGLTLEETGRVLGLSVRQVHRAWTMARAWLRRELKRSDG